MLELKIKEGEVYDPKSNKFIPTPSCTLTLEHSLISVAKWEAKWHIPYLSKAQRTGEQELDYIRCMVVGRIPDENILKTLTEEAVREIIKYIDDPYTATVVRTPKKVGQSKEVITAEVIYHRMFENNIPMECQKWHLNRLLTLIQVCSAYNQRGSKKMSKQETMARNMELNAARRAKYNTRG